MTLLRYTAALILALVVTLPTMMAAAPTSNLPSKPPVCNLPPLDAAGNPVKDPWDRPPGFKSVNPHAGVIPRHVTGVSIAGNYLTITFTFNVGSYSTSVQYPLASTTVTYDGIAGMTKDAPTWFTQHTGVKYTSSIDGSQVNFTSTGVTPPSPTPPTVGTTTTKTTWTSRPASGHTHTCSRGHTWDHTMDGGTHNCPFCGEHQTIISGRSTVTVRGTTTSTTASPQNAAPVLVQQAQPQMMYSLPSSPFGSGCGPNGCPAPQTRGFRIFK